LKEQQEFTYLTYFGMSGNCLKNIEEAKEGMGKMGGGLTNNY